MKEMIKLKIARGLIHVCEKRNDIFLQSLKLWAKSKFLNFKFFGVKVFYQKINVQSIGLVVSIILFA